jgi:opacity protein-like surface antigen
MTRALVCATAAAAALCAAASADTMHPMLGAKLSGMGEHGVVNFQSMSADGKLCWTFTLATKGVTGASIRDSAGMVVTRLGSAYSHKGCAKVSMKALDLIESKPARYVVWVDTKGHPGDLRGKLFAGMAHMSSM